MTQAILSLQSNVFSTTVGFLRKLVKAHQRHLDIQRSVKELSSLSDAELQDIGIARGDIYSVARGDIDMTRSSRPVVANENLKDWV